MPVGKFFSEDYEGLCDDIQELKETCGEHKMKCILETGDLKNCSNIMKASILAMYSGSDYIKTSTGKEKVSATPEAAYVMCQAIKAYYEKTGIQIGFKPAGGINTVHDLTEKTEPEMMKVRNLGRKSLEEVKVKLTELGLSLKKRK